MKPWIVAERPAGAEIRLDPGVGRRLGEMDDLEQLAVDLLGGLKRIAAVDEQHRAALQHDRQPGRTGEAGQPGEALVGRRYVFVLMPVGPRQDKSGQAAAGQFRAQGGHSRPADRSVADIVERLKSVRHGRQSMSSHVKRATAERMRLSSAACRRCAWHIIASYAALERENYPLSNITESNVYAFLAGKLCLLSSTSRLRNSVSCSERNRGFGIHPRPSPRGVPNVDAQYVGASPRSAVEAGDGAQGRARALLAASSARPACTRRRTS